MGQVTKRVSIYILTAMILIFIAYLCLSGIIPIYSHSSVTHSIVQSIATVTALYVGIAALYRYYTMDVKNQIILFLGVGFLGTAIIDAYHTIVTSTVFLNTYPWIPSNTSRWSWVATRIFLSLIFILSLIKFSSIKNQQYQVNEKAIYSIIILLTLVILFIFSSIPIPFPITPDRFISRPEELIPGTFFSIALIGYLIKGEWKTDVLHHWIILCLIASVIGQFFYMGESKQLFGLMYMSSHYVKILSYLMVYIGITAI